MKDHTCGTQSTCKEKKFHTEFYVENLYRNRILGIIKHRSDDNIKIITEKYDVKVHSTLMSLKQSLPAVKNNFSCHCSMKNLDQPN